MSTDDYGGKRPPGPSMEPDLESEDPEPEVGTRKLQTAAAREYLNQLIDDIRIMLTYAREISVTIPEDLSQQIEELLGRPEMDWRKNAL